MPKETRDLLHEFESALRGRNAALADRLQPGLKETQLIKKLERAKVSGNTSPVLDLFTWRNGSDIDGSLTQSQSSPFPKSIYTFMDFGMMLSDFQGFEEFAVYHPRFSEVAGRYFPMFWDGSDNWIAVDLKASSKSRVVVLLTQHENMVLEAYGSFKEFLKDAIRANLEDDELRCFRDGLRGEFQMERCCTFCREPQSKVGGLIVSERGAVICNECIALCHSALRERGVDLTIPKKPSVQFNIIC